ncbi:MAG: pyridoxal 5'-phosphate synthase glutaminase subunit PdxT [Spirochaetia bacterium]
MKIGVLTLQGDFRKHMDMIRASGASPAAVRDSAELEGVSGLIIPGGESTTIGKLLCRFGLSEPLEQKINSGFPVFGTCAGTIILSREIESSSQYRIGVLPVKVSRNAYGRQIESFETDISMPVLGEEPVRSVFIRAPIIKAILDPEVEVLGEFEGNPVFIRYRNILSATFHPELTDDLRIHSYFLSLCRNLKAQVAN